MGRLCRPEQPQVNLFRRQYRLWPLFEALGRTARPFDLALLPIGAHEPRLLMKAVHVNPDETVQDARQMNARRIIAMRWGTIHLADEPPLEPPDPFRRAARTPPAMAAGFGSCATGRPRRSDRRSAAVRGARH